MRTYDITSNALPVSAGAVSIIGNGIETPITLTNISKSLSLYETDDTGVRIWRRSCRVLIDGQSLPAAIEYGRVGGWKLVIL